MVKIIPCKKGLELFRDEIASLKQELQMGDSKEAITAVLKKIEACLKSNRNTAIVWGFESIVVRILNLTSDNGFEVKDATEIVELLENLLSEAKSLIGSHTEVGDMFDEFYLNLVQ